jgi:hypothetical protein
MMRRLLLAAVAAAALLPAAAAAQSPVIAPTPAVAPEDVAELEGLLQDIMNVMLVRRTEVASCQGPDQAALISTINQQESDAAMLYIELSRPQLIGSEPLPDLIEDYGELKVSLDATVDAYLRTCRAT